MYHRPTITVLAIEMFRMLYSLELHKVADTVWVRATSLNGYGINLGLIILKHWPKPCFGNHAKPLVLRRSGEEDIPVLTSPCY